MFSDPLPLIAYFDPTPAALSVLALLSLVFAWINVHVGLKKQVDGARILWQLGGFFAVTAVLQLLIVLWSFQLLLTS